MELLELGTREAMGLAIGLLIPLLLVGAAAALLGGWLAATLGVRDVALAQCLRALAVLLVLGMAVERMAESTTEFAKRTWAGIDEVGEAPEPEPEPLP